MRATYMSPEEPNDSTPAEPVETYAERVKRLQQMAAENEALEKEILAQEAALLVDEDNLTVRQRRFVEEYVVDLNGTQAAIRAGYAPTSAAYSASTLQKIPKIAAAIGRALAARAERVGITQETVLNEMAILANSNLEHYIVTDDGQVRPAPGAPEGVMRAIQSIKKRTRVVTDRDGNVTKTYDVEIKLWDKPTPLRLMGKHVGLNFSDRVEVTGPDGGPIVSRVLREVIDPAAEPSE